MPAEFTEMLLVSSNDYWGHAGSFNSEYNFYPHTFILSQSGYEGLEEDSDRSRFFPCALFYYRGETDNHGFTPSTIGVMVDDNTASVGRVQGIDRMGNRERRTYQVGGATGYSIPGTQLTMMEAPDLNTYSAIEAAADADELTVQGRFNIADLKYNVDEVVNAINQTAGIEVSEAETIGPAEVSPSDPNNYTPMTGPTPEEISATESNEAVEHMAENGTYTHTRGNYTQDSSQAGHGVPEYYGSGSAGETIMQYDRNEMNEMNAESTQETSLQGWGQGDVVGTIIANYDGTPFGFRAEGDYAGLPGAVDDGFYPNAYGEDSSTVGQGVPQWYGSAEQFEAEGEFSRDDLVRMVDEIRDMIEELDEDDMDDMDDIYEELIELEEQLESHMEEAYAAEGLGDYTGPLDNGMGEGTAAGSGNGVPQWYGSAEHEQGYNDRDDESIGMRHRGAHSQSMKDRRDESKGMTGSMNHHHPYSDVGTMDVKSAEGGIINMTNGAILVGATLVGGLVAHFFSKKGETEVSEEAGSVKENKGNGQ
jgi:hypothetical protein